MKCSTPYCRNKPRKGRRKCHTCRGRLYTAAHPDIVAFLNLRKSAKRRGKDFSLTIDQFRAFAVKYDYLDKRGRHATGFTVDRIREWEGYHADNLQVLTNAQNAAKAMAERKLMYAMAKVHGWHTEDMMEPF